MGLLRMVRICGAALATSLTLVLTGCGAPAGFDTTADDGPVVLASFYPLAWVAQQVAGPEVKVEQLTPPGAEPHDAELSPAQVARIGQADLLVTLTGFQAAVDQAVKANPPKTLIDAAQAVGLEGQDPHFWTDPSRLAQLAEPIAQQLAEIDPDRATAYRTRAATLVEQLDQLDQDIAIGLSPYAGQTLVTSHEAFSYLAKRYDLKQVSVSGIDPDQEPSPARLAEVRQQVEPLGIKTVYFESAASPKTAQALASELDVDTAVLDPLEVEPASGSYIVAMRDNLAALKKGLNK
ncbi:MAG: metal ABC transporter substrate-binding protein [Micrococcales bacterium]|nr:metal ABC transporter substrate-binding protein [Micrococcales bacterium]